MNRKKIFAVSLVCFVFSFLIVQAAAAGGIKERMKQRLPRIVEMKKQGLIGENANGYLEYVTDRQPNKALVENENQDRKKIYSAIAQQQGVTIERVEMLRGLQIVEKAQPGEYLKNKDGVWYRK